MDDNFGYKKTFLINHFLGFFWVLLISIEVVPYLQIASFIIFTIVRGLYFGNAMVYAVKLFGYGDFGKGWGFVYLSAGAINILQYFMLDVTLKALGGSFVVLNYVEIGTWVACFFFPIYLNTKWHLVGFQKY